ncbi:neuronal pentraxin-1 [Pteropus alecto]|nr:neuronal pentraxin-1 [Pteropus alecto]
MRLAHWEWQLPISLSGRHPPLPQPAARGPPGATLLWLLHCRFLGGSYETAGWSWEASTKRGCRGVHMSVQVPQGRGEGGPPCRTCGELDAAHAGLTPSSGHSKRVPGVSDMAKRRPCDGCGPRPSQSTLDAGAGEARAGSGRKQPGSGKNTMGDLSRTPAAETLSQLGQTLQSLKTRLENLEQYSRLNSSSQTNSLKDLLQSKIDDLERQVLSRVNTLEEGKGGPKNDTEERVKIESALTSLHQRISELEKGQKDNRPGDKFQLTFPLRTNYMYAKVKKSLPEMYAFTVCMWLRSSAAPGVGTPFSYAVPGQANELVLIEWGNNPMEILINDKVAKLPFVINDGKWHHICITWTTRDGVWEAYQDGTQGGTGENLAPYHPIKPQGVLVLGQEQDTLGGGFDATQAFVGELAHFNIWDRKLTPGEVYNLATCSSKALSGNVIAWAESHIEIYGGATKWTFEACRQIN